MRQLTMIVLMMITVISVTLCKPAIKEDKSVSQVRDQNGDEDEILVTAEQIFLPKFATKQLAERRNAQVQQARIQRRRDRYKSSQRRKNTYSTTVRNNYYYTPTHRPWSYYPYNNINNYRRYY